MEREREDNSGNKTRKITVRFCKDEFAKIESAMKQTTCKNLSLYIRKILLGDEISVCYRNRSLDDFMEEVALLRRELSAIGNNLNQATRKINSCQSAGELEQWLPPQNEIQHELLEKAKEIRWQLDKFSDVWLQYSTAGKA